MRIVGLRIFVIIGLMALSNLLFAQQDGSKKPLSNAEILFSEKQFEFGDLNQGDKISHKFKFRNNGTEPLMILNVQTTCGCTAPEWPKKPIAPGDSSAILVTFNSAKKIGRINKVITVYTNGQKPEEKLKITGNVLLPAGAAPESEAKPKQD
jgi:hypothetical protein